jgi:DNA-binding NarL/FixJ family response regulator
MTWKVFDKYLERAMTDKKLILRSTYQSNVERGLSDREWEVMLAIAKGESPALTANRLGLSVKTVSTYRSRIVQKTGLKSNAEIAVAACRQGLI